MRGIIIIVGLLSSAIAQSSDPYWSEKRGDKVSTAYRSGDWHVECSGNIYSNKNRSCKLEETTGEKTRSGHYDTSGQGPSVFLMLGRDGRQHLTIEPGWKVREYGALILTVGDQEFKVRHGNQGGKPSWRGGDALPIVQAFIGGNYAQYEYPGAGTRYFKSRTSLIGFTKAWSIATEYVGYNPIAQAGQ